MSIEFMDRLTALLQKERRYQLQKYGNKPRSTTEYMLLIEQQIDKAKAAWCGQAGDYFALKELVQAAMLIAACLEENMEGAGLPLE